MKKDVNSFFWTKFHGVTEHSLRPNRQMKRRPLQRMFLPPEPRL